MTEDGLIKLIKRMTKVNTDQLYRDDEEWWTFTPQGSMRYPNRVWRIGRIYRSQYGEYGFDYREELPRQLQWEFYALLLPDDLTMGMPVIEASIAEGWESFINRARRITESEFAYYKLKL